MDYKARFYSPSLGRFIQPDTIIPGAANPQSWNRFSYVKNNPIVFNDPTGHYEACNENDGDVCDHDTPAPTPPTTPGGGTCNNDPDCRNGDDDGELPDSDEDNSVIIDIFETIIHDDFQALFYDNDCFTHGIESMDWTNSKCVDALSFLLQDMATGLSSASAAWTATLTALGCVGAYLTAGLSCAAGYALGYADHLVFFNPLESFLSGTSFALTVYSDYLTDDLVYFNSSTDFGVGVDTRTGIVTTLAGALIVEPFLDAGIDIYASGFNHGYFCGISPTCIGSAIINAFQ